MHTDRTPLTHFCKLSLCAILCVVLTSCAPPKKGSLEQTSGHSILKVEAKPGAEFQTVEINGVEFREARGAVGQYGGTFYDGSIGEGPKTFNPWAAYDGTSSTVGGMMVSGLVDTDPTTGEVVPYLAKSIQINPDNTVYTVTLRKGLTWSDGKPLTADDVLFTWNVINKNGMGNPSSRDNTLVAGHFPEVRKLDPLTIEFKTAKPFAPFLRRLGYPIAPAHVFGPIIKAGGDKAFSAAWGTSEAAKNPEHFVSSGMWILSKYDPSEQKVLYKRNPRFFMVDKNRQPLPYLDAYSLTFVNNMNTLELLFEQGKLDSYAVPAQFLAHVRELKKPEFTLYNLGPSPSTTFLTFNLNTRKNPDTGKAYVDPVKSKWFTNTHFRRAIDWAINRDDMVSNILKGIGAPLFTAETAASPFINQQLAKGHPRDISQAKALLEKAGFVWNENNELIDGQGHRVEFTLLTNTGNDQRENTGVNIKQDLAELGIKVNFKPVDFNVLVGKLNETKDWEAIILGLGGGSPLEPHDGANVWRSDGAIHMFNQREVKGNGPVNLADRFPWELELDDIFEKGAQTFGMDKRRVIYDAYQRLVYEQAPFIYLYSPLSLLAVQSRIQNANPLPLGAWHNLEEIWIKGAQKTDPGEKLNPL